MMNKYYIWNVNIIHICKVNLTEMIFNYANTVDFYYYMRSDWKNERFKYMKARERIFLFICELQSTANVPVFLLQSTTNTTFKMIYKKLCTCCMYRFWSNMSNHLDDVKKYSIRYVIIIVTLLIDEPFIDTFLVIESVLRLFAILN